MRDGEEREESGREKKGRGVEGMKDVHIECSSQTRVGTLPGPCCVVPDAISPPLCPSLPARLHSWSGVDGILLVAVRSFDSGWEERRVGEKEEGKERERERGMGRGREGGEEDREEEREVEGEEGRKDSTHTHNTQTHTHTHTHTHTCLSTCS